MCTHSPEETGVSKSSAAIAMMLLKLQPYEATVVHTLLPCDRTCRVNFRNFFFFLQSAHDGEADPHFTFFLKKHGFNCMDIFPPPPNIISTGVLLIHKVPFHDI
jgi:hypothetical protein